MSAAQGLDSARRTSSRREDHEPQLEHQGGSSGASPNSPPSTPAESVGLISTDFDGDRWFTAPEAVAYGMADEVIGGPTGAPESGTPA